MPRGRVRDTLGKRWEANAEFGGLVQRQAVGMVFFGIPGSRNDINVMNASPLFQSTRAGTFPPRPPSQRLMMSTFRGINFLVDSIYPRYRIFLTIYTRREDNKLKLFATEQEGARKAVERVFLSSFLEVAFFHRPARGWHVEELL
jgi:Plant transposon protein